MEHNIHILLTIILAVGFGMLAQVLAHGWRIPAIVLLLGLGVVLGPAALGVIEPTLLGDGLSILVKLAVAIILFEGALNLRLGELRRSLVEVRNLVTIGVLVSWILTSLAAHYLAGLAWPLAVLFGSLMTVTGPTVVQPLLKRIHTSREIKTILEGEAVLVDPIGAILAVAVLEVVLGLIGEHQTGFFGAIWGYAGRLLVGAAIGVLGGVTLSKLMSRPRLVPLELSNLIVLAGVWVIFGFAELAQSEAGLMAVVAAGLVMQRETLPGERRLRRFKESLTVLFISVLFVLLAANLRLEDIRQEGLYGVLTVLAIMFIIRPAAVFLSTWRSNLRWQEKAFIAWIGPRGIIAASISSLFGLSLFQAGYADSGRIVALTFLTIGMTVVIQGLSASTIARLLGISSTENLAAFVVGAGPFGQIIAELCLANNRPAILIDRNPSLVEQAKCAGFDAFEGNALDEDLLEQAGLDDAETLIAVTPNSEVNTLAAQLAQDSFGIGRAYPALDSPEKGANPKLIQQTGGRVAFGRPIDLGHWNRLVEDQHIQMLVMSAPKSWATKPVGQIKLPDEVLAVARLRDRSAEIVHAEQLWQANDQVIFLTEIDCDQAAAGLEKLGLRLLRQNLATVRQCLEDVNPVVGIPEFRR